MKKSIRFILIISVIFFFGILVNSCKKESTQNTELNSTSTQIYSGNNIQPYTDAQAPKATVKLKKYNNKNSREVSSSLTPALVEAVVLPGGSITVNSTATITLPIERGDVMFMFDLTKSMEQELANVKVNTQNIMGAIGVEINDLSFGVVSHMDYVNAYDYCGYDDKYGGVAYGDYPYQLNQSITIDTSLISQAINSLQIGWGWDYPECYSRVLYELSAPDAGIGWRQGGKKIVVAWLDNQPHDCGLGTGPDPGRDEIIETSDDLDINEVLNNLADNNIVLFVLYSGGDPLGGDHLELWENYCAVTGGGAYRINQDGTVPDNVEIADYIANIIHEEITQIDQLTLQVCDPEYSSWLTDVNPVEYTNIEESGTFPFTTVITVPSGTAGGIYEFDICLIGDGVEYGRQHIKIRVFDGLGIPFDFKPKTCPNPLNRSLNGTIPTAISGFPGFNVRDINIASLNIMGVHNQGSTSFAYNIADPYYPFLNKELEANSCLITASNDGYEDLFLKFNNQEISNLLSGYNVGDVVRLYIEGNLNNGTEILGEDIIVIVGQSQSEIPPSLSIK